MPKPAPQKNVRADAVENRARILEAAKRVFAEHGASGSTDEVAREAGVGVATVFRHFPTKEGLLAALLVEQMEQLAAEAEALAERDDAGASFFAMFEKLVAQKRTKLAVADALADREASVKEKAAFAASGAKLRAALGRLLEEAQGVGAVRRDVTMADVLALAVGAARAAESAGWDRAIAKRSLAVVFDGLRAVGGASAPSAHKRRRS